MELKILVKNYQEAFNNQDIDRLRNLFDSNILLKDWERSVQGIENVIKENKKIFDSVKSLKCLTVKEYYQENTAICVLKINIDDTEIIDVVDIIEFNDDSKITSITAYKG